MTWRWRNVPVPQSYAAALVSGFLLNLMRPLPITRRRRRRLAAGWVLAGVGVLMAAWATSAAESTDLADPDRLVVEGPYGHSRNPMYVAWTLLYLGAALVTNGLWLLILASPAASVVHRQVVVEERRLNERFGSEYTAYQARVRRYV